MINKIAYLLGFLWNLRESYPGLKSRVAKLEIQLSEIHAYLKDISELAGYVKDKDEKQEETFALLNEQRRLAGKSVEELKEELVLLKDMEMSLEGGQAVGRYEIEQKNLNLGKVQVAVVQVTEQLNRATAQ